MFRIAVLLWCFASICCRLVAAGVHLQPMDMRPYISKERPLAVWMDKHAYSSHERSAGIYLAADESEASEVIALKLLKQNMVLRSQDLKISSKAGMAGTLNLQGLEAGNYRLLLRGDRSEAWWDFSVFEEAKPALPHRIPLTVPASGLDRGVYVGIPLPRGLATQPEEFRLLDALGNELSMQIIPRAWWDHGGSYRWVGLACRPNSEQLVLEIGSTGEKSIGQIDQSILRETTEAILVDTGSYQARISKNGGDWLESIRFGEIEFPAQVHGLYLKEAGSGMRYMTGKDTVPEISIVVNGSELAVVRIASWFVNEFGEKLCRQVSWLSFWKDTAGFDVTATWIMTEDSDEVVLSDLALDISLQEVHEAAFAVDGTVPVVSVGQNPAYLLQHDFQENLLKSEEGEQNGKQSAGWAAAVAKSGVISVGCRDFWENFPKQISVRSDGVTLHLWPKDNWDKTILPTSENLLNLPWLHHSKWLNFVVPVDFLHFGNAGTTTKYYLYNASTANALGIAKTHQLSVRFFPGSPQISMVKQDMELVLQSHPMTVDRDAMVNSGVFGPISAWDPTAFPEMETLMENHFKAETELGYRTGDYGMFVLGGRHDKRRGNGWATYRGWRLFHHGTPRAPWILYVRSGDPYYLREGCRISLNCMDFGVCHYSREPWSSASPNYPWRKTVGGLTDYKGYVPWHSGSRVGDYNAITDFLFYFDFINNTWRGSEVATEIVEAILHGKISFPLDGKTYGPDDSSREQAGTLSALLQYYENTQDVRFIPMIHTLYERMKGAQNEKGAFSGSHNYAPWLEEYIRLTRSGDASEVMVRWADAVIELAGAGLQPRDQASNILAYGWFLTQDPKYLEYGRGLIFEELHSVVWEPESPLFGTYQPAITYGANLVQRMPLLLKALKEGGGMQGPIRWLRERSILNPVRQADGSYRAEAFFLKETEQPVSLVFGDSYAARPIAAEVEIWGPNGELVYSDSQRPKTGVDASRLSAYAQNLAGKYAGDWVRAELPRDLPNGLYRIILTSKKPFNPSVPFTENCREMYPFANRKSEASSSGTSRMAFRFPEETGVTQMMVRYKEGDLPVTVLREGNVKQLSLPSSKTPISLSYTKDQRDVLLLFYRLERFQGHEVVFSDGYIPKYYAASLERLFDVERYLNP